MITNTPSTPYPRPMGLERDAVDAMLEQWSRERPDLDASGLAIVLRVLFLSGVLNDRLKAMLAPTGLAPWEFDVLSALRRGGSLTAKELCESAQLTSGAMTHRIDRLEERGLVVRAPAPEDRRSVRVSLTTAGKACVDGVIGARMEDAASCISTLDEGERYELARLLRNLSVTLDPEE